MLGRLGREAGGEMAAEAGRLRCLSAGKLLPRHVSEGCSGLQGGRLHCGESFPSPLSAGMEQNTLCVNRNKPAFPAKVLKSSLFAKWLHYLLWLRLREMLLFKGENKWRCFPPSPFLSANSGISGLQFLINK